MNKFIMVSSVAFLAGMGQVKAAPQVEISPSPDLATPGEVNVDPFGNGVVVNTGVTINGQTNINGALVVDGVNVKGAIDQKASQADVNAKDQAQTDKNDQQDNRIIDHDNKILQNATGLIDHNVRINNVQNQANATDGRLNNFNGGGLAIESWAGGIDSTLVDHNNWLNRHETSIDALKSWREIATNQIGDLYKRSAIANEGVAMAMALPSLTLENGKRFGVAANMGMFAGESAFGAAMAFRLNESWQINGGVSAGLSEGQVGGRVGVMYQH